MSVFDTFVAKRQTLVDFCNHRAGIVKLLAEHDAHFQLIQAEMKKFYQYGMPEAPNHSGSLMTPSRSWIACTGGSRLITPA